MKAQDLIWAHVRAFEATGFKVRYVAMTAVIFKHLLEEVTALGADAIKNLVQAEGEDKPVEWYGMELIILDLPAFEPVKVSGTVQEQLVFYQLNARGELAAKNPE